MILTLMLVILTATLVIVIIGFVMDRMAITAIKSGMRTLNKRIKRLERVKYTVEGLDDGYYTENGTILHDGVLREASDDSLDTKADSETQEADGGDISLETDDEVQDSGD